MAKQVLSLQTWVVGIGGCAHVGLDRTQPWGFRPRPVPRRRRVGEGRSGRPQRGPEVCKEISSGRKEVQITPKLGSWPQPVL